MDKVIPPKYAQRNALDAKRCLDKGFNAMTKVGKKRMNQLINREPLSKKDLKDINSFRRHIKNAEFSEEPCKDKGYIAWKGWGLGYKKGKPNLRFSDWAKKKLKEFK